VAAERGGAGGKAVIDVTDLLNWTEGIPRHPTPRLPFLSPGLPGRGFSFSARTAAPAARRPEKEVWNSGRVSYEETDNPPYADHWNFKVELWTKGEQRIERLLFAGSSLDKARAIFAEFARKRHERS
jgi:hypothetical protein